MGRTAEVLGDKARARASYQTAARETDTFHGLLAMQKLSARPPGAELRAAGAPEPTSQPSGSPTTAPPRRSRSPARRSFGRSVTRVFLLNLPKIEKDEAWAAMAAHFARVTGDTQTAVRIGKAAIAQRPQPRLLQLSGARAAEIHAAASAARDGDAVGPRPPGDRVQQRYGLERRRAGILQVMKVTANHICRDYKIKCTHDRLLTDDSYNIMIASAYVADRMAEWQGSYVLALSSYNAGPGRTRQWIKEFGDPRTAAVDPIDWIERIPFEETRRYVAKVLSNIQIYRARLGEEATALRLDEDLIGRGRRPRTEPAGIAQDEHGKLTRIVELDALACPLAAGDPFIGREVRLDDDDRRSLRGHVLHVPRRAPAARAPLSRGGRQGRHARPALCLPGLTRNGRDFHDLAVALSRRSNTPRTVYTLDYRGRGLSDFDPDWRNYTSPIEMLDVLDFMTVSGLHDAAVIGTSRGGLITMLMAAAQPTTIGAVVLNDIGPVIEHEGLARISGYVGRVPLPFSWPDAARMVRELNRRHFPEISETVWEEVAHQWYNERNGKPAPGYDSNLGNALSVLDGPMPALWPQFEALKRVPLMVVRGENSDILTARRWMRCAGGTPRWRPSRCPTRAMRRCSRTRRPSRRSATSSPRPMPDGSSPRWLRLRLRRGQSVSERPVSQFTTSPSHSLATKSRRRRPSTGEANNIHASPGPAVR